ncbi:MAG: indole-3-glycerol-phosphate synthase TrpC, partial [Gracilibacteraceae bacterium]|nr:indole-3-glycerol-phosphate synthase TrpC [Gracilibacteraceae bacterium]
MSILSALTAAAAARVESEKSLLPPERLRELCRDLPPAASFAAALRAPGMSFICEVKRASPSRGLIAPDFPYRDIARDYEAGGAAAVSVLTEPEYFLGSDAHLREIAASVSLPVLRKDFIIDEHQILTARLLGAAAVLLICA